MSLNYLGQLLFLAFLVQILTKCKYYPVENFNLPRLNEIITDNYKNKKKSFPPKFPKESGK